METARTKALEAHIGKSGPHERWIIRDALIMFRDELRHVSYGIWPDMLVQRFSASIIGRTQPIDYATALSVLRGLASTGLVKERSPEFFASTDELLAYLDRTSLRLEWGRFIAA